MQTNNNFDAINQAVNAESEKQFNINKVARSKNRFFNTAFVLLVVGGLLLIALLILTIFKLYYYEPSPKLVEVPYVVEKIIEKQVPTRIDEKTLKTILSNLDITNLNITNKNSQQNSIAITDGSPLESKTKSELSIKEETFKQEISNTTYNQENNQVLEGEYIKTSFTIFHSATTANGEVVVTGKQYSPDNIKIPISQFCYLQSPIAQIVGGKNLATVESDSLNYTTTDNYEKKLANEYCVFDIN